MDITDIFTLDTRTLIGVLFWYNFVSVGVNRFYRTIAKNGTQFSMLNLFSLAKVLQALAFLLIFYRAALPDFVSVNLGNSCLFAGFTVEAVCLMDMLHLRSRRNTACFIAILAAGVVAFNVTEQTTSSPSLRVAVASICVFAILLAPSVLLVASPHSNRMKRLLGVFYLLFTCLLLPRILTALRDDSLSIFTNNAVQSLTFLSLLMVDILGNAIFLLMSKESVDKLNLQLANTDHLTKLHNRYSFFRHGGPVFAAHQKSRRPLSVLFFDLDRFKEANDTYGHAFGDKLLQRFADVLRGNLRASDLACRYGGEEFVVLVHGANMGVGLDVADRILAELRAMRLPEHPDFTVTASCGLYSDIPLETDSFIGYIEEADHLMYAAKNSGRDRVEAGSRALSQLAAGGSAGGGGQE